MAQDRNGIFSQNSQNKNEQSIDSAAFALLGNLLQEKKEIQLNYIKTLYEHALQGITDARSVIDDVVTGSHQTELKDGTKEAVSRFLKGMGSEELLCYQVVQSSFVYGEKTVSPVRATIEDIGKQFEMVEMALQSNRVHALVDSDELKKVSVKENCQAAIRSAFEVKRLFDLLPLQLQKIYDTRRSEVISKMMDELSQRVKEMRPAEQLTQAPVVASSGTTDVAKRQNHGYGWFS